jgi:hypothetical protein
MSGAELADAVVAFLRRFVVFMDASAADFLALWTLHTWSFEAAMVTPYVRLTSPERESGKTRALEALALLVRRPWLAAIASTAVVFRKGDAEAPTLLLDEVDLLDFASRTELLAVLNSGYRHGIKVPRCDDRGEYRDFDCFYPKAYAGLGASKLPDTLHSRSVTVRLQRRRRDEPVERFFHHKAAREADPLRAAIAAWGIEHVPALAAREPELPEALRDREQEVWEPLLAIADELGGDWPERARQAAIALAGATARETSDAESNGVRLLDNIGGIFVARGLPEVLLTGQLLAALNEDETLPWGSFRPAGGRADGLRATDLAALLRPFEITPGQFRVVIEGKARTRRGYLRRDFFEAWGRYLPESRYARYAATDPENAGDFRSGDDDRSGVAGVAGNPGDPPETLL